MKLNYYKPRRLKIKNGRIDSTRPKKHRALQVFLVLAGFLLILDTLLISVISNFNFGVILPAIIGAPLFLIGIFFQPLQRGLLSSRFLRVLRIIVISAYTLLTVILVVTGSIIFAFSASKPDPGADAVIVLGAGIHGDQVTILLAKRLRAAIQYHQENPDSVIVVTGGQGPEETITEAEAMSRYLIAHGIPEAAIIKEESATSTQENFRFSKQLLDDAFPEGYRTIYVTNDFHVFRAGLVASKEGLHSDGLSSQSTEWYVLPNCYLREIAAVWAYFLLGWF